MKIEHNGKTFELDFEKALQSGLIKELVDVKLIVAGNIFKSSAYRPMILIQVKNGNFLTVMCDKDGDFFSSYDESGRSAEDTARYLNKIKAKYIGCLNSSVSDYVRNLVESNKK